MNDEPFIPIRVEDCIPDEIEVVGADGERLQCYPVPSELGIIYIPEWFGITCWG